VWRRGPGCFRWRGNWRGMLESDEAATIMHWRRKRSRVSLGVRFAIWERPKAAADVSGDPALVADQITHVGLARNLTAGVNSVRCQVGDGAHRPPAFPSIPILLRRMTQAGKLIQASARRPWRWPVPDSGFVDVMVAGNLRTQANRPEQNSNNGDPIHAANCNSPDHRFGGLGQ